MIQRDSQPAKERGEDLPGSLWSHPGKKANGKKKEKNRERGKRERESRQ